MAHFLKKQTKPFAIWLALQRHYQHFESLKLFPNSEVTHGQCDQ